MAGAVRAAGLGTAELGTEELGTAELGTAELGAAVFGAAELGSVADAGAGGSTGSVGEGVNTAPILAHPPFGIGWSLESRERRGEG
ncbi:MULTISPECIES: hypothetical protein [Miniimonas]|uniref:hypothetical protein n=1 Tax=Miniimonas TaxID=947525 RepID=UPI001F3DE45E|nr:MULTISPECIES: hypothetical protein [Miniimonas]